MTVPAPEPGPVWYGESFRLDGGRDLVADEPLDVTPWFYHFDGKKALLEPGMDVIVGAYADSFDPALFAAYDESIVLRWVIEVDGGGSVDLWAGTDPSRQYTDPDLATQYLGTLTASGPGTLISEPLQVIDHAGLVAQNAVIARLRTSEGLSIVQVKLRAWPVTGAGGAWRLAGEWYRTDASVERWSGAVNGATPKFTTYEEAWQKQREQMAIWDKLVGIQYGPRPMGTVDVEAMFTVGHDLNPPFQISAGAFADSVLVFARPGGAAIEPGITYGYDPGEVWREEQSHLRAPGGGPAQSFFDRWTDEATITPADPGGTLIAGIGLGSEPTLTPDPDDPTFRRGRFIFPTNWLRRDAPVPFTQIAASSQFLAFTVMGSAYYPPAPTTDVQTNAAAVIAETLPFRTRIGNYEWFDPTAPPAPPSRKPRFYVTYTEVETDPREVSHVVGIGKPADDASLFRVPAPLGTLRELRHGEKVSDVSAAHPLKVKLDWEGNWTIVAGMTLDD